MGLDNQADVIKDCSYVLKEIDAKNAKALFRRAHAYTAKERHFEAAQDLELLVKVGPSNISLRPKQRPKSKRMRHSQKYRKSHRARPSQRLRPRQRRQAKANSALLLLPLSQQSPNKPRSWPKT